MRRGWKERVAIKHVFGEIARHGKRGKGETDT